MKYEDSRKETPFATRDHMLDVRKHVTELTFRGFGIKSRKLPKEPSNFSEWSAESRAKWKKQKEEERDRQAQFDRMFIEDESRVLRDLCRRIVFLIDQANVICPQTIHECDVQRDMQNEAIGLCSNLIRELNHIQDTIPSNANFLALLTEDIEKELDLLRGWRTSCWSARKRVAMMELQRKEKLQLEMSINPINQ